MRLAFSRISPARYSDEPHERLTPREVLVNPWSNIIHDEQEVESGMIDGAFERGQLQQVEKGLLYPEQGTGTSELLRDTILGDTVVILGGTHGHRNEENREVKPSPDKRKCTQV